MWLGITALLVAGFIGGQSPFLLKIALKEFPPLLITILRFIIASVILFPFFIKYSRELNKSDIRKLAGGSIFFAGNVGIFGIAIQYTGAIVSNVLYTMAPIIVGILSFYLLSERFTKYKIIGAILAFLGMAILIVQSITNSNILSLGTPLGNILTLGAVFSHSFYFVISKRLTKTYSPVVTSFISYVVTVLILIPFVLFEQLVRPFNPAGVTAVGLGSIIVMGIVSSALMFFLIQVGIQKTSAFTASFYQYLGPLSAAITAIPLLGERLTGSLVIAGGLIIIGVFYATTYAQLKKQ